MNEYQFYNLMNRIRDIISGTEFENHVFCVGGAVRDLMMEQEIKDIDLVVNLSDGGIRFAEWLESNGLLAMSVVTYPAYGTAMFRLSSHPEIEIESVQTRKEKYDRTSRKPSTSFGTIEDDCMRRDLTINALYYSVSDGSIHDPSGLGIPDSGKCILRTPSDADTVYDDDPLRILRCIRFFCRLNRIPMSGNWSISKETADGMKKNAFRLDIVSRERVHDELCKMIRIDFAAALKMLNEYGVFPYVFRGFDVDDQQWDDIIKEQQVLAERYEVFDENSNSFVPEHVALATLFTGRTSPENAKRILVDLKFPKFAIDIVVRLMDAYPDFMLITDSASLHRMQFRIGRELWLALCEVALATTRNILPDELTVSEIMNMCVRDNKEGTSMFWYKLPVNGDDVMEVRSIGRCPEVGQWLKYALDIAYRNPLVSRNELLDAIRSATPDVLKDFA